MQAAYAAIGLQGEEDFSEVRARFRALIKQVHPDTAGDDPERLGELHRLLKAYELLQTHAPRRFDLEITAEEARKGGLRTVTIHGRSALVRLPAAVAHGAVLTPVGDPSWRIHVQVRSAAVETADAAATLEHLEPEDWPAGGRADLDEAEDTAGVLRGFYEAYVRKSPSARLVGWARRGAA